MNRLVALALVSVVAMTTAANSAEIANTTQCLAEIQTIKTLDQKADAGPKFEPIVDDLIGVLEHLCQADAFEQANDVAAAIRAILSHRTTG